MATTPNKTIYGQNVRVRMFIDGVQVPGLEFATKCSSSAVQTMHRRNYLDRKRAVTDKHVDGYDLQLAMDLKDNRLIDLLRARDDLRDASQPVPDLVLIVTMKLRNGRESTYTFINCEDKVDWDSGERVAESTYSVQIQAEDRKLVASGA